jgi:glycine/D-amino acid oxidase-like deaminating enzyme
VKLPFASRTGPVAQPVTGGGAVGPSGWVANADGGPTFGNHDVVSTLTPDSFRFLGKFLPALVAGHGSVALDVDGDLWLALRQLFQSRTDLQQVFEKNRILGATHDRKEGRRLFDALRRRMPQISKAHIEESWGGVIDETPDRMPIVEQTRIPGLYLCTGFSTHGLAMAPAAAVLVADLVTGRNSSINPSAYSSARFRA